MLKICGKDSIMSAGKCNSSKLLELTVVES